MLSYVNVYTADIDVPKFLAYVSMTDTAHATEEYTFFHRSSVLRKKIESLNYKNVNNSQFL
jgi:hypothetical protein